MPDSNCGKLSLLSYCSADWIATLPAVGEEAITDGLLYGFTRLSPPSIVEKFNRHREANYSGADLDLVLLFPNWTLLTRIQAKKLVDGSDHYLGLAHSNQQGFQIDMLRSSSARDSRLALYAFYTAHSPSYTASCCTNPAVTPAQAVFLASADRVYDKVLGAARSRVEAADLIRESVPMECVACCSELHKASNAAAAALAVTRLFRQSHDGPVPGSTAGVTEQPPREAQILLSQRGVRGSGLSDFPELQQVTTALVVLDLRNT